MSTTDWLPKKHRNNLEKKELMYLLAARPWGIDATPAQRIRVARTQANLPGRYLETKRQRHDYRCNRQRVSDWESERLAISNEAIDTIARRTGVSSQWIVFGYEINTAGTGESPEDALRSCFVFHPSNYVQPKFLRELYEQLLQQVPFTPYSKMQIHGAELSRQRRSELLSWCWYLANKSMLHINPDECVERHLQNIGIEIPTYTGPEMTIYLRREVFDQLKEHQKVSDGYRSGVPRKYVIDEGSPIHSEIIYFNRQGSDGPSSCLLLLPCKPTQPTIQDQLQEIKGISFRRRRSKPRVTTT